MTFSQNRDYCIITEKGVAFLAKHIAAGIKTEVQLQDSHSPIYCTSCKRLISRGLNQEIEAREIDCACGNRYFLCKT